jgi:transmembrane sensor
MTWQPANMEDEEARPVDPLTEEALAWLVRLHSGEETEADWNGYHDWKQIDRAHADAAQRAESMWSRLGPALIKKRRGRNLSGAIVLAVLLAGATYSGAFGPSSSWLADEATGVGERRTLTLADGSAVTLDSATSLDVEYGAKERRIVLRDGQIFVTVKPDAARRFVVEAEGGSVWALGTAFNVRMDDAGVRVAVTEHAVRVTYGPTARVDIREGQGVGYASKSGLGPAHPVNTNEVTAWTHGRIVFDNQPLHAVVDEIGRYQRGTVVFTDSALRELTVTGVLETDDADAFFEALERTLPVRVIRLPYLTVIRSRAAS